jgi:bicarbonate transport system substrate-binding protein
MSNFSRRKFLTTAAVSTAGAVVLKACGNPPDSTGGTTTTAPASPVASPVALAPERLLKPPKLN